MNTAVNRTCIIQDFNISDHLKGFLIALENHEELGLFIDQGQQFTPVQASLANQLFSWISEEDFSMGAKLLIDDDYDLMDGINLVEPFYIEFFTQNRMEVLKHLCSDLDSEENLENTYKIIMSEISVYDDFDIEHIKTAFLSPKHTTLEELNDEDIFDNAYFYTAEFASGMIAREVALAYNNYIRL